MKTNHNENIKALVRFVLNNKKKWAAAGLMLMLGGGTIAGSYFYVPQEMQAVAEETASDVETLEWEPETAMSTVLETTAEQEEWVPSPGELNLTHYFPEGADQSDLTKSLAGEAFKVLMTHDEEWMSGIYDFSDVTPAQMASRLGRSVNTVRGRYNPRDSRHDRSDSSTWTINSFKNIRMTARDGDGNAITPYSNVLDIMSMANLYTYFKGVDDYDLFLSYSKKLWELSHSYTVGMSEVYYCSGCMSEDAERREMEALEAEARAEALGLTTETPTDAAGEAGAESGNSAGPEGSSTDGAASKTTATPQSGVITAGRTTAQKESSEAARASSEAAKAQETSVPESTSGVITSNRSQNQSETHAATETPAVAAEPAENPKSETATPVILAMGAGNQENAGDSGHSGDGTDADSANSTGAATDTGAVSEDTEPDATPSDALAMDESSMENGPGTRNGEKEDLTDCPGHVDLIINMRIIGLDESSNLFQRDTIGNDELGIEEGGWPGWNQYTRASARLLSDQDWFQKYGLTVSAISARNPLTSAEIEAYMTQLPVDLSEERKALIRFALNSVGKVPYYWGGKPSAPNYTGNSFGVLTAPDQKGRIYKGLDCSGWINWVYWSVTGRRLPYESTSGLAVSGTRISRDELKPGDIIVRTGADAHVIMFLGWTADGRIRCIHESSAAVNNVTVAIRDANWPYYRKLVE